MQEKLNRNNAIITKADKGNSIVITYTHDYHMKIMQPISNNFDTLPQDPTNKFQKTLQVTMNKCHRTRSGNTQTSTPHHPPSEDSSNFTNKDTP
jgi:hypothetical protein